MGELDGDDVDYECAWNLITDRGYGLLVLAPLGVINIEEDLNFFS
jgi:hypothetical protein